MMELLSCMPGFHVFTCAVTEGTNIVHTGYVVVFPSARVVEAMSGHLAEDISACSIHESMTFSMVSEP
jgi:hypothetical protein